jgi:hypothetical protein
VRTLTTKPPPTLSQQETAMPLSLGLHRPKGICFAFVAVVFVVLWLIQDSRFVRNASVITSSSSQWQGVVISKDEWWVTNCTSTTAVCRIII